MAHRKPNGHICRLRIIRRLNGGERPPAPPSAEDEAGAGFIPEASWRSPGAGSDRDARIGPPPLPFSGICRERSEARLVRLTHKRACQAFRIWYTVSHIPSRFGNEVQNQRRGRVLKKT
ncbi:hypothetical protein Sp245p_32365 (plasmid) [Azospirillum baldaniorum]|uniref:Uncharacterized protein n=1 Tax=Azospirillum baldaniorum TaxID=1064539 RepID=A0A9P1NS24_9PROT|nr:hypothetical protein Sp245p_32365 [Azospirillum baldaniorum]CCD03606.1 protein of unknown function [Azospirillum baldaniorum]